MSDNGTDEPTHRVVNGEHRRSREGMAAEVFEPGDELTPTEAELRSFGDRFESIDDGDEGGDDTQAESGSESGGAGDESEASENETDAESDAESDESEGEGDEAEGLSREVVEDAERPELRSMASEFDEINGNWGEDRLRAELLDRIDDEE